MRLSVKLVIFNLFLSGAANVVVESGIADAFGAGVQPGAGAKLAEARQAADSVGASGLGGETLAGMFVAAGLTLEGVFQAAAAAPIMFANLGVPDLLVGFIFAPMVIVIGTDIIYALTGRDV